MDTLQFPDIADMIKLRDSEPVPVIISGLDMLYLLSAMQLAVRHPELKDPVRCVVTEFARALQKRIVEASPAFAPLCEAGWDPEYDGYINGRKT